MVVDDVELLDRVVGRHHVAQLGDREPDALPLGVLEFAALLGVMRLAGIAAPLWQAAALFAGGWLAAQLLGHAGFPLLQQDTLAWCASVAYRISKHLELGTYQSRFISDTNKDWSALSNHIYDQTVTARVDINRYWNFKVEGHFIDGYGSINSARGFYLAQNPNGFQLESRDAGG